MLCAEPTQKWKQAESVDRQKIDRGEQLCCNLGDGDDEQASGRNDRDQLTE